MSSRSHKEIETEFLRADWIIPQLFDELNEAAPSSYEGNSRTDSFYKQQRLTEFAEKCNSLFPLGRKFVNYRQLDEYVTQFLHSWKIAKNRNGYSFRCFYAESKRKSESKIFSDTKNRIELV